MFSFFIYRNIIDWKKKRVSKKELGAINGYPSLIWILEEQGPSKNDYCLKQSAAEMIKVRYATQLFFASDFIDK